MSEDYLTIEDLYEILNSLNAEDADIETVDAAVMVYNQAKVAMGILAEPFKLVQKDAKDIVAAIVKSTGRVNWNKDLQNGSAYVPEPYPRVSYDKDLLDKYLADDNTPSEVKTILRLARKETMVNPSLTIK